MIRDFVKDDEATTQPRDYESYVRHNGRKDDIILESSSWSPSGWAPVESAHCAHEGGLLSENHVIFWYSAGCTLLKKCIMYAMCGCAKRQVV